MSFKELFEIIFFVVSHPLALVTYFSLLLIFVITNALVAPSSSQQRKDKRLNSLKEHLKKQKEKAEADKVVVTNDTAE
jgi:hypothetical protein